MLSKTKLKLFCSLITLIMADPSWNSLYTQWLTHDESKLIIFGFIRIFENQHCLSHIIAFALKRLIWLYYFTDILYLAHTKRNKIYFSKNSFIKQLNLMKFKWTSTNDFKHVIAYKGYVGHLQYQSILNGMNDIYLKYFLYQFPIYSLKDCAKFKLPYKFRFYFQKKNYFDFTLSFLMQHKHLDFNKDYDAYIAIELKYELNKTENSKPPFPYTLQLIWNKQKYITTFPIDFTLKNGEYCFGMNHESVSIKQFIGIIGSNFSDGRRYTTLSIKLLRYYI